MKNGFGPSTDERRATLRGQSAAEPRAFPFAFHCVAPMEGTGLNLF